MTPKENAALLMQHAHQRTAVMKSHKTHKLKKWFAHKTSQTYQSMETRDKVKLGITAVALGGSIVVSAVLTGGLSIGILAAIAGTSYALKKLVKTYGHKRLNRNWLRNYKKAYDFDAKNYASALGVSSKDAIRRAVDHYNQTLSILKDEVQPFRKEKNFATCEDAINWAKSVARFVHHADKTRNYLLPCIDTCVFFVMQYKAMLLNWERSWDRLEQSLIDWFTYHNTTLIGHCNKNPKEICYGITRAGTPRKPSEWGSRTPKPPKTEPVGEAVDVYELAKVVAKNSVECIEKAMKRGGEMPDLVHNNFAGVLPQNISGLDKLKKNNGDIKRFNQLINDVFAKADHPGYFARGGRSISHTFTRRTTTEKITFLFGESLDLASVATPFIPTKELGTAFNGMLKITPKTITSGSLAGTSLLNTIIGDYTAGKLSEKATLASGLMDSDEVDEVATGDIRAAGVQVQDLIKKIATHFHNAIKACQELESIGGCKIENCRQAWEMAKMMAIAMHELKKMEKYLLATLAIINFLANETIKWSIDEPKLWREMEGDVAVWLFDVMNHHACRDRNKHCYGPKRTSHVRGGTFSSWVHGRRDYDLNYDMPHKPL